MEIYGKRCRFKHSAFGSSIAPLMRQRPRKTNAPGNIRLVPAIKSKVYRLIDALVVGEKTEAEVQDSIRRWWDLIHPADRPIAQKYLMAVLARSDSALDAISEGMVSVAGSDHAYVHLPARQLKVMERMVKEAGVRTAV